MRRLLLSLLIGLVVGAGIGLYFGWVVSPVQYVQSPMADLSRRYKDEYTVMVATAYQVDGDLNEAIRRLQPLGVSNIPVYVREVTERYISESGTGKEADIRNLVVLSRALGYYTPPMQAFALPTTAPTPGS
jgi:hypothetical protein